MLFPKMLIYHIYFRQCLSCMCYLFKMFRHAASLYRIGITICGGVVWQSDGAVSYTILWKYVNNSGNGCFDV